MNSLASFDIFLANFEAMLVSTLLQNRETLMGGQTLDPLLRIVYRYQDKSLLEQSIGQSLRRALNGKTGHTFAYSVDAKRNKSSAQQLQSMINQFQSKESKKAVFMPAFDKVVDLLADLLVEENASESKWSTEDREFRAALRLIHDALISREVARRPAYLSLSQG